MFSRSNKPIELSDVDQQEIVALAQQERVVEAVQRVMQLNGAGLKEAKDYVDQFRQ